MGDFTGFKFGNKHSSDLGIIRVSNGDRYDEQLHPEVKDITAEIPGLDGEYYFGSNYGTKTIDLDIAFDHITEEQFREIRRLFSSRKPQELIFDERPYKKYLAKIESPVELSYICFDEPKRDLDTERNGVRRDREKDKYEDKSFSSSITIPAGQTIRYELEKTFKEETLEVSGVEYILENNIVTFINESEEDIETTISYTYEVFVPGWETVTPWKYEGIERVYKGEGKISFACRFPFAKSVMKSLKQDEESEEWAISSGILSAEDYQEFDIYNDGIIKVYNPGDIKTGFRLYLPAAVAQSGVTINYKPDGLNNLASLIIKPVTLKKGSDGVTDMGVLIDTTNEIIAGVAKLTTDHIITTSGNIYNEYIEAGYFFKLETNSSKNDGSILEITNGAEGIEIFYDYLYF